MDNLTFSPIDIYVLDPENAQKNYDLAVWYHKKGQTAAAISFYLRAAERTDDKDLSYECLLLAALCFDKQGNRAGTVKNLFRHAITLIPDRPEAYFLLSRFHEYNKEYNEGYLVASIGMGFIKNNKQTLNNIGYVGEYGLIFEKAVCAWWWGKTKESRKLFLYLSDNYADVMDDSHKAAVQNNMTTLGCGPESQAVTRFSKKKFKDLRYKFKDAELIDVNYSQVYQDMFVLSMLDGKKNGTYLEVGSSEPYHNSNTAILEKNYGWTGIGLEWGQNHVDEHLKHRSNKVLCEDATKANYSKILKEIAKDGVVDYLQLDCEPSKSTFEILTSIPFNDYKFAVITYEHDHYVDMTKTYRQKSRNYLRSLGYLMAVNDISPDGVSTFEDWWYHPELIDPVIAQKMSSVNDDIKKAEDFMLGKV
jgi:hypothetical protein